MYVWLEVLAGSALGIGLGAVSGLVPGVHSNTMAVLLLALYPVLILHLGPVAVASALIAALITHTFLDIVPSTLLGIPDPDTALSVLPAHRLCLTGAGQEAIRISALGSALGAVASIPVFLLFLVLLPSFQPFIDWWAGILILIVAGLLVIRSEAPSIALALLLVSGLLGIFSLRYSYVAWNNIGTSGLLMPLLSGLFGMAALLSSSHGKIPMQRFEGLSLERQAVMKGTLIGTVAGSMVGWLPGLSTATANGLIASFVNHERDGRGYILATSAANTANAVIGLAAFYAIGRMRNGVMVALSSIPLPPLHAMLEASLIAACCAYMLTILLSKSALWLNRLDTKRLNISVMVFVSLLSLMLTGPFGILILACATLLGLVPPILNVPRMFLMGAIMIPVMLISFGIPAI
ncbi:MAG: tripartite tricarboxylate transporter permease [Methanomicrobiales archaeon]|nr:tripartite tricarboxylate transporter permease [Methanomicrobiales archaeon]